MRKFLAIALMGTLVPIGASTSTVAADYAAIAAGMGGYGWVEGGYRSMEAARAAAKRECIRGGHGGCDKTVAERSSWYFSGGNCDGYTYVGTSAQGQWRADDIVRIKAARDGNYNCVIEVRF